MGEYICGESIRRLRETAQLTQKDLAQAVGVTDKAVSKWETGRGLPDISLLDPLAKALGVSLAELLAGDRVVNANKAGNMVRSRFYVCPICGNVLFASGDASISCCGVSLPVLEAEEAADGHAMSCEVADGEVYVTVDHPMSKDHFISFIAYVTSDRVQLRKLYPEQLAEARFTLRGSGSVYCFCNKHELFSQRVRPPKRNAPINRLV